MGMLDKKTSLQEDRGHHQARLGLSEATCVNLIASRCNIRLVRGKLLAYTLRALNFIKKSFRRGNIYFPYSSHIPSLGALSLNQKGIAPSE
jgi:hypothetical protein